MRDRLPVDAVLPIFAAIALAAIAEHLTRSGANNFWRALSRRLPPVS